MNIFKKTTLSAVAALTFGVTLMSAPLAHAHEAHIDLAYGTGERNVLDLYMPDGIENPPVVLFIHGGAWFRDNKDEVMDYRRLFEMNKAGIAVATMNHTYSRQAIWPAQKNDVKAAMQFLHDQAETYGYDISRFGVWGQSSGAHLALWAGVLSAEDPSLGVDAVVSWYAPSDMHFLFEDRETDDVKGGNERTRIPTPEDLLVGEDTRANKAKADLASPAVQAALLPEAAKLAPHLLIHGDADNRVSPKQSQRVYETYQSMGVPSELVIVENGGHGGRQFEAMTPKSIEFLLSHMK